MIRGKRPIRSEDARLETNDTIITDAVAIKLCSVDIWQSPLLATRPGHAEYIYIYIYNVYTYNGTHTPYIYISCFCFGFVLDSQNHPPQLTTTTAAAANIHFAVITYTIYIYNI